MPIIQTILTHYPDAQAIYLFGSWGTAYQTPHSDLDIAVLLPPATTKQVDMWEWITLSQELASIARLDLKIMVDVIEHHLDELLDFAQLILLQFKDTTP